nr:sarcosine oxidase subunit gamma family protein [Limobrevibacterium gyesilva]
MQAGFDLQLPSPGNAASAGEITALWIQPDAWMLVAPRGSEGALAARIKAACGDAGSVVDQTHGRTVLHISGRRAAWVLAKLCRVDLHPSAFGPGRVAVTPVADLACVLHHSDAAPGFDLIVFSSYAVSFLESLTHAALETGYDVA